MSSTKLCKPKQTRKHSPKVKTGCKTCKARRVKCDEAWPSCFRCTSTGRTCEGYSPTREAFQIQIWSHSQASKPHYAVPVFTEFGDNVRYLEFYHHCAQPALSRSSFDKEFWSQTALRMALSEPAVRHALIALGYLYQNEPGSLKHARSMLAHNERGTLVFHYNESVRCLVERMAGGSCPPEIALVACVLFVCIDFLRGNYHAAFTHLTNGLKIISERQQRQRHHLPITPTTDISETTSTGSVGRTTMIEEQIVPIFIRGIASALMYGVFADEVFNMPWPSPTVLKQRFFRTLREAQEACYELRNVSIIFVRNLAIKFFSQHLATEEDFQRQDELLECHRAWLQSVELLERQQPLSREDRVALSALKVSHYSTLIYVSCATQTRQKPFDAHLESFTKILLHAKAVIDSNALSNTRAAHYTFDISVIPPLYFVATRCRCPTTRRDAVSLLERDPPREGLWDARQHVVVCNRAIEMEESGVDPVTGWPVEETRLWSSVIDANMDRNGGFWVTFLPARWLGEVPPEILKTKLIWQRFVL